MLESNFFAEFLLFFRPIHNSIYMGFLLVFWLSFFLKGRFFNDTQDFSIKSKSKKKWPYIYLGHLYNEILCITFFGKSFAIS